MRASRSIRNAVLTAFAVSISLPAVAAFERVSLAYEVSTRNFTAPASTNGGIVIRECDSCEMRSIRVTAGTAYTLDGKSITLDEFKDALVLSGRDTVLLTVLHHLESDTVLRVSATSVRNNAR